MVSAAAAAALLIAALCSRTSMATRTSASASEAAFAYPLGLGGILNRRPYPGRRRQPAHCGHEKSSPLESRAHAVVGHRHDGGDGVPRSRVSPARKSPSADGGTSLHASTDAGDDTRDGIEGRGERTVGGGGGGGNATMPNLTFTLIKSIVGSGVLGLPAAASRIGSTPHDALVPALVLILVFGCINAYFFALIGKVCSMTGAKTYREAWERSVGPHSAPFVAMTVTAKTLLSCLAYSMILADTFRSLFVTTGWFGSDVSRTGALLVVTVGALLPLCLKRDLESLAPYSILGLGGMAFTALAMVVRYWDGSYSIMEGGGGGGEGRFVQSLSADLRPSFDNLDGTGAVAAANIDLGGCLVLSCTLASAFVAHYNSPRFHSELADCTDSRFNAVVGSSYLLSALAFAIVTAAGYLTFGGHASGFVLSNYSPHDPLATLSRAAVAAAIVCTYPIVFLGFRDGVLDLVHGAGGGASGGGASCLSTTTISCAKRRTSDLPSSDTTSSKEGKKSSNYANEDDHDDTRAGLNYITVGLLGAVTVLAANVQDLSLVLSVGGGTFSTAVASIFPALMYRSAVLGKGDWGGGGSGVINLDSVSPKERRDVRVALGLMCFCGGIGIVGVALALQT